MYNYKRNGFTLVELMAVIIIISLIALLTFPNIINQIKKTKKSNNKMIEDVVIEQTKKYVNDNKDDFQDKKYCFSIDTLVDKDYVKDSLFQNNNFLDKKVIYITKSKADGYNYKILEKDKCNTFDYVDNDGNGYTEVEYIEATGEQYIDTEYVFKIKPKVTGGIMIMSQYDTDIMGTPSAAQGCFIIDITGSTLYYRYSTSNYKSSNINIQYNKWYNFEFSDKVLVEGVEKLSIDSYDFSNNTRSFFIGKGRSYTYAKFKEIKMYDGDELVRDLVPVYRNSDKKPGMFDIVNKKFYTSKTDKDFYYPIAEEKKLPDNDSELEYIETDGKQYINTGYVFKNKPKVTGNIMLMIALDRDIMGTPSAAQGCFIIDFLVSNVYYRYSTSNYKSSGLNTKIYNWYNFEFSDKVIVDGVEKMSVESYDFSSNTQSFLIGKGRNYGYARYKEIKMYDGDELVRDFVPYYKKDINKVGMLDKVHNVFYENQGTGEFLWG